MINLFHINSIKNKRPYTPSCLFLKCIYLVLFILFSHLSFSQYEVSYSNYRDKIKIKSYDNIEELKLFSNNHISKLNTLGYIYAKTDTIENSGDSLVLKITRGEKYYWGKIELEKSNYVRSSYLQKVIKLENKNLDLKQITKINYKIVKDLENNGYPFAQILTDTIRLKNNKLDLKISVKPNSLIRFDSLEFDYNLISYPFLSNYLDIKDFKPYNELSILRINNKIQKLDFLEQKSPFKLSFSEDKAKVLLDLVKKKVNSFNGIIGFQPSQEDNTLQFTGQFFLNLTNTFKIGESLIFEWSKLEKNSQELHSQIIFPFVFLGDFGFDAELNIEKFDTLYVTTNTDLTVRYAVSETFLAKANSEFYKSNLLIDNDNISEFDNFSSRYLGLGFLFNTLDNNIFPNKGILIDFEFNIGNKSLSDSSLSYVSYKSESRINAHKKFYNSLIVSYSSKFGYVKNDVISKNEMYKLGGIKTIRGFNEKSILAPSYLIQTAEIAYQLDNLSKGFLYYDFGITNLLNQSSFQKLYLHSLGAGINIATQAGIFNFVYALGRTDKSQFSFKDAKIHFGYISVF